KKMKFAVVTGVSKGLGESIATFFLATGINVIGISRTANENLTEVAKQHNSLFSHYVCDLSDLSAIEYTFAELSEELFAADPSSVYLENNAAALEPIDQAMQIKSKDLAHHAQVKTIAQLVITNSILQRATENEVTLLCANVTSGAAE